MGIRQTDILIIGGGIAGLTLALLLARGGVETTLVEPYPPAPLKDTKPSGRTVALMDRSLHVIQATEVWDDIAHFACAMRCMRIIDDSMPERTSIQSEFESREIGLDQFGYNIPNATLRAALHEAAQNHKYITILCPAELADFQTSPHHVTATLADGSQIRSPLIVGVDGRKSLVRKIAGIHARKHDYKQSAITCLINHSRSHNNTSTEFHRPGGPLALVPLDGNRSAVVWVEPTARAEQIIALKKQDFVQKLQDLSKNILGGITLESAPECWPLISVSASRLTAPRTVIAAEAAHVISPITAQGLNLSLRDMAALAETILDAMRLGLDPGAPHILRKYERRRHMDTATRVLGVNALNSIVSTEVQALKGLRRLGLKAVDGIGALKGMAMRHGLAPKADEGRLSRGEKL